MKKVLQVLTLLFLGSISMNAQAVWSGAGDGTSWNDAANWESGAVPASGENVEIGADVTITGTADATPAQVKAVGNSTVTLDLDLTVGDGVTEEHALTVSSNSTLILGAPDANRTFVLNPEVSRQGFAIFGSVENGSFVISQGNSVTLAQANNGVNLSGPGSNLTNDGDLSFSAAVNNAFKVLGTVTNNGTINISAVTGDAVGVGEGGNFVNNGTISADKPNNDVIEVEGGTFTNNGVIDGVIKDDAGSGNNVVAVGTAELAGTFINSATGVINGDAGIAENARAISVNEMGTFTNAGTMTLTGGNDGSRFYTRGVTDNDFHGVIDLTDGRINVNMGTFTNGGLIRTTRDGAGVTAGEMGTAVNNAFIDYASTNNFAIGMGTTTDNGLSINANAVNYNGQCFDTIALQTYEYFYEGNSIGSTNAAGELDVTGADFINPDSTLITTSIPGVEFFIKNYCDEAVFSDIMDSVFDINPTAEALRVYPTVCHANTSLIVDLENMENQEVTVRLIDISGKVLTEYNLQGGYLNSIDLDDAKQGTYFLAAQTQNGNLIGRLVVQN